MEQNSNKILQELKEISPLLIQVDNTNPYTTSFSYFSNLADDIIGKIKSGTEAEWYLTKENAYSAPAGYFETLPATIVQKIKGGEYKSEVFEELENISPLLNTISKKTVYSVPKGYLDSVNWNKSELFVKKAKVISLRFSRAIKYTAAAVIIGLLAIGIFLITGKQNTDTARAKAASEVKQLSEQEIVDFLKTTSPAENIVSTVNNNSTKENDIKSSVSKMSDNEIQQFLKENGEQVEM